MNLDRYWHEYALSHCGRCDEELDEDAIWADGYGYYMCSDCADGRQCDWCGKVPEDGLHDWGIDRVCEACKLKSIEAGWGE